MIRNDKRNGSIEVMMERNVNSAEEFANQQNVLHMRRSFRECKGKIIEQIAIRPRRFMKHQLQHQMIFC